MTATEVRGRQAPTSATEPAIEATTAAAGIARLVKNRVLPPLGVFALAMALWYFVALVVLSERTRFLLPPPHTVMTTMFDPSVVPELRSALVQSVVVSLMGLTVSAVLGVAWATAMVQARWVERSLFPYAVVLQCIPILALVPLIGFWFGFGFPARVIVCIMISLFPIVSNTLFGLRSVDTSQRELFELQRASRWTVLRKLQFPAALPAIFAGLRISAGLSVVGAVVGDFFFRRGTPGLGSLISTYQSRVQGAELFAAITVAAAFGVAVFIAFGWLQRRAVGRWYNVETR